MPCGFWKCDEMGDIPLVENIFMNRRSFLSATGSLIASSSLHALMPRMFAASGSPAGKPNYSLRIEPCTLDIGPGVSIKTVAYKGQVPVRCSGCQRVPFSIDVTNATSNSDIVHWHGLAIDSLNDGAMEEGSPMIPAGATHRYSFTPNPAGTRWYHTHASSYRDLSVSTYTGQFGFLLIEGRVQPEKYDQEINLAIHHWEPSLVAMLEPMREQSSNMPLTSGSDVGYRYATINAHMLGAGEPIRVKKGQPPITTIFVTARS
jgi:hypothetical protein